MSDYYEKLDKAKAEFLRDAGKHEMLIKQDDGVYRHIRFSQGGSSVYHFDITTWPGYLCISGDMGCFVFARTMDMFTFFRGERINPSYWSEKLQATNNRSGHRRFSFDLLKEAVAADFEHWDFDSDEQKAAAWKAITDDWDGLFYSAEGSDLHHAVSEVMDWECPVTKQKFQDFWEHDLEDYTHHFMWCCNAIQWAIQQYDAANKAEGRAA
ncbi:hypothetical protein B9J07_12835 [Sinorhizobium sp. LM21]|uniref:hypothetical protein n=1 Tax=Sinorhizobium phage phiLM21 TaxID=1524882 RepID=UPI0004E5D899|nr:hypothetical protein AWJ26_gp06 [Sinorhizobium phage phiLM21]AII27758.1 hypothetical protein phiLM21_p006 [Sinorhizobium phage phiLM21]OWZ93522.1 hypothetical protein B9J07_12835 [Sinorhizobium sp. LM21]